VLVIDGVEFLKENEKFMVSLVGYAKARPCCCMQQTECRAETWIFAGLQTWADKDYIRVVFVTSAGRFVDVVEGTACGL